MKCEKILKEYIDEILLEFDDGGDYGYGDGGGYGGGNYEGSVQGLANIFVTPFTDVMKTTKYAVSDISSRAQQVVGGILGTILSSVIPFAETDFKELKQKADQRSEQLLSKYSDVLAKNSSSMFKGDGALFFSY